MVRVRVPDALGLWPTHWLVKPDPGLGARLLVGRAGSSSLAAGPGNPEFVSDQWWWEQGRGVLVPDTVGYGVHGVQVVLACSWVWWLFSWSLGRVWLALGNQYHSFFASSIFLLVTN